jgi:uncharacterized membrane protein YdjX (TVP38/TMEM64 family)/membrane-associated phospholipid phosphatase
MNLHRPHPHSLSPRALAIAGWIAFVLAGLLFLAIAWNVSARSALIEVDLRLVGWLHARDHPLLVALFLAVTHLNSTFAIVLWSAFFGAALARLREWYWMLTLAVTVGGALLLNVLLKQAYERLRPHFDAPLLELATYSFPSGHTAGAVAFYGVLGAFLVSRFFDPRRRAACVAGAVAAVALVAASRVYLGAHYPSDVLAATCAGTAWLVLCLAGGHALAIGRLKAGWVALGALGLLAALLAVLLPLQNWSELLEDGIQSMSLLEGLLVFVAVSVTATLLLVPAWIFPLIAGAAFGFAWGVAAAMASAVISAVGGFLLARHVLGRRIERIASRSAAFSALNAACANNGWQVMAMLRLSPVMPSGLKSYFLGLTRARIADYVSASAIGMLPGVLLKVYVGAAGRDVLSEGGGLNWTLFAAGIAATVGVGWLLSREARKRLAL